MDSRCAEVLSRAAESYGYSMGMLNKSYHKQLTPKQYGVLLQKKRKKEKGYEKREIKWDKRYLVMNAKKVFMK